MNSRRDFSIRDLSDVEGEPPFVKQPRMADRKELVGTEGQLQTDGCNGEWVVGRTGK